MRIRLGIPQTIFADLFISAFPAEFFSVTQLTNPELHSFLSDGKIDAALLPSLEIINDEALFVSKRFGIAFDGVLSDDYLYFPKNPKNINKLSLAGTVSLNEIVLSRVIFRENYNIEVEQNVIPTIENAPDSSLLVSGDINFANGNFMHGDSFAELIADFIDTPYLKYILAANNKSILEFINQNIIKIEEQLEITSKGILKKKGFDKGAIDFVLQNFNTLYFELTETEINGYKELRQIPFYYGLTEEMKEVTFV